MLGCGGSDGGGPAGGAGGEGGAGGIDGGGAGGESGSSGASGGVGGDGDAGGIGGESGGDSDAGPGPKPDGGMMPEPQFPADEDADGDGLDNGTELELGTDPRYRDTDMDGVADDAEVGADPSAALDGDDDGVIDALEHPRFDNDRDDITDDVDAADGAQIVYGRFVPAVVANDGRDSVRFELKLMGGAVESASVRLSPAFNRDLWAPDELAIDGEALGDGVLELFDDGTHGDVIAGDQVFTRDGITTEMAIRGEFDRFNGQRCRVLFDELSMMTSAGETTVPIGTTDGVMPRIVPDFGFWLMVVDAATVPEPEVIEGVGQRASHALNVVDAELAVSLAAVLMRDLDNPEPLEERRAVAHSFSAAALAPFEDDADFIYAFTSEPVYSALAGSYFGLANDASGIGLPVQSSASTSGSAGRLRGVVSFSMAIDVPLNHETMHSWGVHLEPVIGTPDSHWGTAGTYGVLGGFDPATLVDHGAGTFTVGHFYESGNDWSTTPFSTIELYLMGVVPAAEVTPIPVLSDIEVISNDIDGVMLTATRTTVTIDDIVAAHGARSPDASAARKDFASLFVIFSERELSPAELALVNHIASEYEQPTATYGLSFEEATGGRATMTTALPND
jgi:hypothetical protein